MRRSSTPCRHRVDRRVEAGSLLLLLLLGLAGTSGCVTRGRYTEVVAERDTLTAEKRRLTERVRALEASSESLAAERAALIDELEDLRIARERLEQSVQRLKRSEKELLESLLAREEELAETTQALEGLRGTYNTLVADLEAEVAAGQIQIEQLREGLRLNVAQDILFGSGSTTLSAGGRRVLEKVAAQLRDLPHTIEIQGHTDDVPVRPSSRFASNWELAAARASGVVRLFAEAGIEGSRMKAVSFGEFRPVADNATPEGRLRNRRIEIRLEPAGAPVRPDLPAEPAAAGAAGAAGPGGDDASGRKAPAEVPAAGVDESPAP